MRFPKATREVLHASHGKPVQIDWPLGEVEPVPMRHYTVQSSHRAGTFRILVLFVNDDRDQVWARIDDDPVMLLGKSGGYVQSASGAMGIHKPVEAESMGGPQFRAEYEPEAVSEADLAALNEAAATERRARIVADIAGIEAAMERAEENPDLAGSLRFLRNLLAKQRARHLELSPEEAA